ncbi:unnamed protein product, partial [Ixodes hexagonus]
MQTVTNFFIANLALSDILLCALAVPFTPLYHFMTTWAFGSLLCHLVPYAQGVSVYISAFTLMAIAIDRFFVVIYPFRPRMRLSVCFTIIISVWGTSALLTLPYGIFMGLIPDPQNGKRFYCEEEWPSEVNRKTFSSLTTTLQFLVPLSIITFCYVRVCCRLQDRVRAKPGARSLKEVERKRTRRTNRMLISMVLIFAISWMPLNLYNLVADFYIPASKWPYSNAFFFMSHAIAMSSTCYNPFLYAWLNENFRKEFKLVLPGFMSPRLAAEREADNATKLERTLNGRDTNTVQETVTIRNKSRSDLFSERRSSQATCARYVASSGPEVVLLELPVDTESQATENTTRQLHNVTTYHVSVINDYITSIPAVKAFFYCIYILIFVVGICGNVLVCYVVFRNKSMQTVTNFFITNLGLSDILLCTLAVPFTPLYQFMRKWVFGRVLCHLVPYAQGVSVYISSFTLMAIAIDRFFVIIYPFKPRLQIKVCFMIIISIWLTGALLTLPYGIFMHLTPDPDDGRRHYCEEKWPDEESRRTFSFSTSTLQFVVPFGIISFCYMRVCCKLRDRARAKPGAKSVKKEELERKRTRRTNRMLISMVVIFGASWLPLNLYNLVMDFFIQAASWKYANAFFFLSHAVAMSSTCYNPFLYTWLNENFRKEFKLVLPCF